MKLSDIIVTEAARLELQATTRDDCIVELVSALAEAGAIKKQMSADIAKKIIDRENRATTGIGKGVALPHATVAGIKKPTATVGLSIEGLDFHSLDNQPVYSVILMVSPPDKPDEHLAAMEMIFTNVRNDMFRKFLSQAKTREAVAELIAEADETDR